MNRLAVSFSLAMLGTALITASAVADPADYGFKQANASTSTSQAGAHPDFDTFFELNTEEAQGHTVLPATTAHISVALPPGFLANPRAVPVCTTAELTQTDPDDPSNESGCPQASQVGITEVELSRGFGLTILTEPVFNMEPALGEPARLGFIAASYPILIGTEIEDDREYAVTARIEGPSSLIPLFSARTTLWGVPADEVHDGQRITPYEALHGGVPETENGKRPSGLVPTPFMLNPTRCAVSQGVELTAIPYALPTLEAKAFAPLPANTGCALLDFQPSLALQPTSATAETATGLDAELTFPQDALRHPNLNREADQRRAEVTLPAGITVNPSQAEGLSACSEAQFGRESASSAPGQGCPEAAKIGTATATSPLLEEPAQGSLYVAEPYANPFQTLIAVYLVLRVPERGVVVRLAGKVSADPATGRLTTVFGEAPYEIPQLPVASFHLHFREGPRAPLITPERCGTYTASATFTSWSGRLATLHPSFEVSAGNGSAPCPSGPPPFHPAFEAGAINNDAGAFSSYYLRFSRSDTDQELTRFATALPPGSLAKLAGVSACSDAEIAAAATRSGAAELAAPSCPPNSQVGRLLAGAGVGTSLTYVPGRIYLAGPYRGAPLSIAAIVPALAGPFDLGTVVTQVGLRINPQSGIAEVDGSRAEPLPRILAGIPLELRDVRVYVDRPDFSTNPTSCDPEAFAATLWGAGEDPLSPADDSLASLSERFQAANCSRLPFKPKLALRLKGPARRTSHPRLIANLTAKRGEANIARAQVKLPPSAFLDQGHIKTICTRVQFAADNCPPGSIYGKASARTPLLDSPLSGPVYLRSSSHNLPDLVVKLKGPAAQPIEVDLVGRTDSVKGALRNTFEAVPDAPVSKFHLELLGGKRGLIELSSGLCKHPRAQVQMDGQNGKTHDTNPVVKTSCPKKHQKPHKRHAKRIQQSG